MSLTDKQRAFVDEYLVNGFNATQAYLKAYPDSSEEAARSSASALLTNPNVKSIIEEEQKESRKRARMSKDDKLDLIEEILLEQEERTLDKLKAIEIHNKMTGDNEPEKHDHKHEGININYNKPKK
jgi:phage terminase small subunit